MVFFFIVLFFKFFLNFILQAKILDVLLNFAGHCQVTVFSGSLRPPKIELVFLPLC